MVVSTHLRSWAFRFAALLKREREIEAHCRNRQWVFLYARLEEMIDFERHIENSDLEISSDAALPGSDNYFYYWWWQNACIADSGGRL